ncbi:hypothetical protein [Streptomyces sp. ISL-94]|uniref:hypothetical protein n=1 Tax=Streptomyces sp. ISL-94 TaxID=2819190 RepID=UPI001BE946C1|nr:hypothetical protein [Streptomyces sp. ISL-94]MBT2477432.1 hypothetical protein [Streptomyces sp. ISL-94]
MVEEDLVRQIAREVVEHVAPHELVLFHAESSAYFRDPCKALKAARKRAAATPKDERFGFGGGELIAIATPIVLAMVETALVTVCAHLALTATERGAGSVRALVRRMLRRRDPAEGEPADAVGAVALAVRRRVRSESPPRPVAEAASEGRLTARRVGLTALLLAGSVTVFACTTDKTDRTFGSPAGGLEEVRSACRQYDELLGSLDALTSAEVHTRLDGASQLAVQGGEPALALAFMEHFKAALEGDSAAFETHGERINQACGTAGVVLVNLP